MQKNVTIRSAIAKFTINVFMVDRLRRIRYIWIIVAVFPINDIKNKIPRTIVLIIYVSPNTGGKIGFAVTRDTFIE